MAALRQFSTLLSQSPGRGGGGGNGGGLSVRGGVPLSPSKVAQAGGGGGGQQPEVTKLLLFLLE